MEDLYEVSSKLSDMSSTLSSLHSDTQYLSYIHASLNSISSNFTVISIAIYILFGLLISMVIKKIWVDDKDDSSVDNYPEFTVVKIFGTEKDIIINFSSVIKIESTDEGRAKITLSNGSEFELVETFEEIQKNIFGE